MRKYLLLFILICSLTACNASKSDTEGDIIQNFYNYPNPFDSSSGSTTFRAQLDLSDIGKYSWTLTVYTESGSAVYTTSATVSAPSSPLNIVWNGKNNSGNTVQNGVYKAIFKINVSENASGSYSGASYQSSCNPVIY